MTCLDIGGLRTHEMRELEGDGLVVATSLGGFQFQTQLVKLDREELDRHVAVEAFCVGPAFHAVFVGQFLVDGEESIQFVVVDVTVLECTSIYILMDTVEVIK